MKSILLTLLAITAQIALAQDSHDHAEHAVTEIEGSHSDHDLFASGDAEPTESERRHVPPDPPQGPMGDMSNERMIELMGMDDGAALLMFMFDELEWREIDGENALQWDAQSWWGDDYNKAWLKSEGSHLDSKYESSTELLWDRVVSRWWSTQAGIRHDMHEGPSRTWMAFGVQGIAPHWIHVEATGYIGEEGRTAMRLSGENDVLLTQRLILQPAVHLNMHGKSDAENGIGSGLADTELAIRLRYELRREFAPYIGVVWTRLHGRTADFARMNGHDTNYVQFVAGVRAWF